MARRSSDQRISMLRPVLERREYVRRTTGERLHCYRRRKALKAGVLRLEGLIGCTASRGLICICRDRRPPCRDRHTPSQRPGNGGKHEVASSHPCPPHGQEAGCWATKSRTEGRQKLLWGRRGGCNLTWTPGIPHFVSPLVSSGPPMRRVSRRDHSRPHLRHG
jgi:hypothetical protein